MADNLTIPATHDTAAWSETIKLIDTDEPVQGGLDGVDNIQAQQLAARSQWLRAVIGRVVAAAPGVVATSENLDQLREALAVLIASAIGAIDFPDAISLATTNPVMDGAVAVGTAEAAARADHRHPVDTSRAPLASPAFTGTPTAPTPAAGTSTTQIATTAFVGTAVAAAIAGLVNSSPAALDTLQELAAALGNDADFATTMTNALAAKAPLASPIFTGTPKGPTPAAGTNTTQLATTEFVGTAVAAYIPARLSTAGGSAPSYGLRAWARWASDSGTPTIVASGNVSSITDLGTGYGRINHTTPMPDALGAGFVLGAYDNESNTLMGGKVFNYQAGSVDFRTYVAGSGYYYDLPLNTYILVR